MTKPLCAAAALFAASVSCSPAADGPESPPEPAAPAGVPDRIDIPPTVRSNLGITFARVESRRVASTLRVPGVFELRPRARREYRMALSGRVELLVDQYEHVEPGRPLFRFQSPVWPELLHEIIVGEQATETALAEIEVARARAAEVRGKLELARGRLETLARADFKRADLEAEAAGLAASLPRMDAELRLAETRLSNARRTREHALHRASTAAGIPEGELEKEVLVGERHVPAYSTIDWIDVRAAVPGVVEMLSVTDGAFVEPPATVLSTVDPGELRFRALALQGDLPGIAESVEARIVPPREPGIPLGEAVAATVTLGLEAHPAERTMTLLATPDAPVAWARPGVSAFLEIVVASTEGPALAVPRSAVVQDGLTHVFFRRDPGDPNRVLRVEADLGIDDGRWVVLKSGVAPGDEVVLEGAYELKLATEHGGTEPAGGHVHADGSSHADH